MGRKPSANANLPPHMRKRVQRSGKVYYYLDTGERPRKEIPLGSDYIVVLADSADELRVIKDQIVAKLASMGLTIHPRKVRLAPTAAGVPFLGYVVWPNHISAGAYVRGRYIRRLREHETGTFDRTETLQAYGAMLAHTGPTN